MNPVLIFALGELVVIVIIAIVLYNAPNTNKTETKMIRIASVVLTCIGLLFALSMAMYYFEPTNNDRHLRGKDIFDKSTTVLSPLITLVLGYYFGTKHEKMTS